jgi:hypothetical protein
MKSPANYRTAMPATPGVPAAWLPRLAPTRTLNPSHWLSRAAHGHSWNAAGAIARRRPN